MASESSAEDWPRRAHATKRGCEATKALGWLSLIAISLAVHVLSLTAEFLFDDYFTVEARGAMSWRQLGALFLHDQSALFGSNFYRPLLTIFNQGIFLLAGQRAFVWHLSSLLLHTVCVLLVFRLAQHWTRRRGLAWLAAALFVVLPVHVEAITWISAMGDLLATALMLAATLTFVRWSEGGRTGWWWAAFLCAIGAMLSKETGVVLVLLLPACALALPTRRRSVLQTLLTALPFFALLPAYFSIRATVLQVAVGHVRSSLSAATMLETWPAVFWFYARQLLWPTVAPYYPLQPVASLAQAVWPLLGIVLLLAAFVLALWRVAGWRTTLVSASWLILPLLPVLYLKAFVTFEYVHARFLYASAVGFALAVAVLLGWVGDQLEKRYSLRLLPLLAAVPLLAWSYATIDNSFWWQSDVTLFTRAIAVTPDNPFAYVNLAYGYTKLQREDLAVELLQRSLSISRTAEALNSLGRIAWEHHEDEQAEQDFAEALRIKQRGDIWMYYAGVELRLNRLPEAEAAARRSIEMLPEAADAHQVLGVVLLTKGDRLGAVTSFGDALRLDPANAAARQGLALAQR